MTVSSRYYLRIGFLTYYADGGQSDQWVRRAFILIGNYVTPLPHL